MTEQPQKLREYLIEAEGIARDWYSREGFEESHEQNIEALATLFGLTWMLSVDATFADMREAARVYLVAAFQMGRAGAYDDDGSPAE